MKSFQQMSKKIQNQRFNAIAAAWGCDAMCYVKKRINDLKRFHPAGQTETSMGGVIRDSR